MQSNGSGRHLGAGMTMVAVVVLFTLGGIWLDGKTGLGPLFLLVGFGLGALGGFLHLVAAVAPEMLPFGKRNKKTTAAKTKDPESTEAPDDPSSSRDPRSKNRPVDPPGRPK